MKFISSREIRSNPACLWDITGDDESVITVNGKPRAIVVAVGDDLEETLASLRRARAFRALEKIGINNREKGPMILSDQEIEEEISRSRSGR